MYQTITGKVLATLNKEVIHPWVSIWTKAATETMDHVGALQKATFRRIEETMEQSHKLALDGLHLATRMTERSQEIVREQLQKLQSEPTTTQEPAAQESTAQTERA